MIDLTGERFARLSVIRESPREAGQERSWVCVCDCGEIKSVKQNHLRGGRIRSCGCLRKEELSQRGKNNARMGPPINKHPVYVAWSDMKQRCYNPKNNFYSSYGGRGIYVCDRWVNDFRAFLRDMGPRPKGKSLDRIGNNGPYSPENCRWATPYEQIHNRGGY